MSLDYSTNRMRFGPKCVPMDAHIIFSLDSWTPQTLNLVLVLRLGGFGFGAWALHRF